MQDLKTQLLLLLLHPLLPSGRIFLTQLSMATSTMAADALLAGLLAAHRRECTSRATGTETAGFTPEYQMSLRLQT